MIWERLVVIGYGEGTHTEGQWVAPPQSVTSNLLILTVLTPLPLYACREHAADCASHLVRLTSYPALRLMKGWEDLMHKKYTTRECCHNVYFSYIHFHGII